MTREEAIRYACSRAAESVRWASETTHAEYRQRWLADAKRWAEEAQRLVVEAEAS